MNLLSSMNNSNNLLPIPPNFSTKYKLTFYGLIKNILLSFVILGGIYILVDEVTDQLELFSKKDSSKYSQCEEYADILGNTFEQCKLNAEKFPKDMKLNSNVLNMLKEDIANLKKQVMTLWRNMKDSSKYDLPEMENKIKTVISDSGAIDFKIKKALDTYDADKLALYDYAAEYAGGEVLATPGTTPYPTNKIMQIFGFFKLTYSSSPNEIIRPSTIPGDCFKFYTTKARIIIKLGKKISIGSVSMEHSLLVEDSSDAPRDFNVFGIQNIDTEKKILLGSFTYHIGQGSIQSFPITCIKDANEKFEYVELQILNNHGNVHYTSIYRFRVHAKPNN